MNYSWGRREILFKCGNLLIRGRVLYDRKEPKEKMNWVTGFTIDDKDILLNVEMRIEIRPQLIKTFSCWAVDMF